MDNTASSEPPAAPFYPSFQEVPRCARCGKQESELQSKMKRCAGCTVTFYCSKECQKAAWPIHKQLCRYTDKESGIEIGPNRLAGFPALIALENALVDWDEVHSFGLCTIANAVGNLRGGVDACLASSRILIFRALPRPPTAPGEKTPANAFRVAYPEIVPKSDFGPLSDSWDRALPDVERTMARIHSERPDPTYAGLFPAVFVVPPTGFASFRHFPVCRLRRHAGMPLDTRQRAVLEDVARMSMGVISAGFVMRVASVPGKATPEIGTLVRRGKKWEWRIKENWDWAQIGMGSPARTKSGLHPHRILTPSSDSSTVLLNFEARRSRASSHHLGLL